MEFVPVFAYRNGEGVYAGLVALHLPGGKENEFEKLVERMLRPDWLMNYFKKRKGKIRFTGCENAKDAAKKLQSNLKKFIRP